MKIYCEECGESYNIDPSKIPENKNYAKCKKCKNIINLNTYRISQKEDADQKNAQIQAFKDQSLTLKPGFFSGIGFRLVFTFLLLVLVMGACLSLSYLNLVPKMVSRQIELRAEAVSKSFSAGIAQPLLLKNYLAVSKTAAMHTQFPGVAYAVVLNKKGIMVTGLLGSEKGFSKKFNESVSSSGFPSELVINNIPENSGGSVSAITIDGKKIYDSAADVGKTGGIVHVGIFADKAGKSIKETFIHLSLIFLVMVIFGSMAAFYIGRKIAVPLSRLAMSAKEIASGEIDSPIEIKGNGEIKILSQALEEMRKSVRAAIYRLRKK